MLTREPGADTLLSALETSGPAETTPIAVYEAVLGLSRKRQWSVAEVEAHVGDFLRAAGIVIQPIQPEIAHVALDAFARYGKGRGRPARLNLGDCFIYAQAKAGGASLLYKGDDFSKTDVESASRVAAAPRRRSI